MGKLIRRLLAAIAIIVGTAIIQPTIERALEAIGWYEGAISSATSARNWIELLVGSGAFPWLAGAVLGLAVGVWVDPVLRLLDGTHPLSKSDKAKALYKAVKWQGAQSLSSLARPHIYHRDFERLLAEGAVLAKQIERLGIPYPMVSPEAKTDEKLYRLGKHFELIAPALNVGDIDAARKIAHELNQSQNR